MFYVALDAFFPHSVNSTQRSHSLHTTSRYNNLYGDPSTVRLTILVKYSRKFKAEATQNNTRAGFIFLIDFKDADLKQHVAEH